MRRRDSGVTLIELLIAVTLVSLLAVGILIAMRVGLNAMDKSNTRLTANRRAASVQQILESQIADIMPVKAFCLPTPDKPPVVIPFFQGDPQAMRFVSAYSLQQASRGMPVILEYQVIPGENDEGVRLIVNERLYAGPASAGATCAGLAPDETGQIGPHFLPIEVGPASFVLADKLAYCRFTYRQLAPPPAMAATWFPHWTSKFLPNAIRVEMAPLHPDASRVQMMTMTVPVHVFRDIMAKYGM